MKRLSAAVLAGVFAVLAASTAQAQYVFFGGGLNLPMSDFKDGAKTGWIAQGGLGFNVGKALWIEGEGWYGSNKSKVTGGAKTDLWAALAAVGYDLMPGKKLTPYILGGAGLLGIKHGETKLGYTAAVGLGYQATSKVIVFFEGRWLAGTGDNSGAKMVPITAGLSIHFGK